MVAKCEYCNKDMRRAKGCTLSVYDDLIGGLPTLRVKFGQERQDWGALSGRRCGDCGCQPGNFHHPGCCVERCSNCFGQAMTCECTGPDEDDVFAGDACAGEGSEDEGFTTTTQPDRTNQDPDHANWLAIEAFFGGCGVPEVGAFMYMGTTRNQQGAAIWMYKHYDTRKYMWLDIEGNPYRPCDWNPALVATSREIAMAMAMAYDGIDEGLFLSCPGSMPRYEIFPMKRNRPEVA